MTHTNHFCRKIEIPELMQKRYPLSIILKNDHKRYLTPSSQKQPKYISLAKASQNCRYSAKYLNLLATQEKLEAHKVKRNWITTKKAIQEYIEGRQRQRNKFK